MTERSVPLQHIIHDSINVQGDDGPAACVGFQVEAVVGVVVEEILSEGCATEGILQDVEVVLLIGIAGCAIGQRAKLAKEPQEGRV